MFVLQLRPYQSGLLLLPCPCSGDHAAAMPTALHHACLMQLTSCPVQPAPESPFGTRWYTAVISVHLIPPLQRDEVLKVRAQLEDVTAERHRLKVYCPNTFGAELAALARHDFPADKVRRPHRTSTAMYLLLWAGSLLGMLPALLPFIMVANWPIGRLRVPAVDWSACWGRGFCGAASLCRTPSSSAVSSDVAAGLWQGQMKGGVSVLQSVRSPGPYAQHLCCCGSVQDAMLTAGCSMRRLTCRPLQCRMLPLTGVKQ